MRDILRGGPPKRKRKAHDRKPIKGYNYRKAIVQKVFVKHPKKPNSGNRQCALVRLTTGRECIAYIPGEGHNLQEHSQVHGGARLCGRQEEMIDWKDRSKRWNPTNGLEGLRIPFSRVICQNGGGAPINVISFIISLLLWQEPPDRKDN
uniref:Small ribosomal subunit protein uS12m n=1 Tax=Globodera rostochiensis TaxID=31243 RepID=A0A914HJS4_GLORO